MISNLHLEITSTIFITVYMEKLVFKCSEGTTETLITDQLIALTGKMEASINVVEKTRLFVTYVKESPEGDPSLKKHFTILWIRYWEQREMLIGLKEEVEDI